MKTWLTLAMPKFWVGQIEIPPSTSCPLYLSFPSPSLKSRPLNRAMSLGERCKLTKWGLGQRKANLMHFSLTIWHLMSTILLIFLKINWQQCRINEHTGQLLVEPNALWHTQPKFWVGHGSPGPHCRLQRLPCGWWNESQEVDPEVRWCVSK